MNTGAGTEDPAAPEDGRAADGARTVPPARVPGSEAAEEQESTGPGSDIILGED
ncbi:hypothetical protein ACIPJS_16755 [Streptomyces sp. NPDC086783]|uniref:hypothetical protein n=1 Tax=Streptomyces sp. NPDC086783 TaxID=3365758 RepID=UPI0038139167